MRSAGMAAVTGPMQRIQKVSGNHAAATAFRPLTSAARPMRIGLRPDDLTACRAAAEGCRLQPRPRLYGIGMGKTGTNVLASLFTGVPAAHEPEAGDVITALLDYEAGRRDWRAVREFVVERDRRLGLTVDVSNLNIFLVDLLVDLAPDATFVLTIRDPWSWLDAITNQYLRRPPTAEWRAFAEFRFGAGGIAHPAAERILAERGLHPLAGYLAYWRDHLEKALAAVPADRLLVVPVGRIAAEAGRIAAFAGLPADSVAPARVHEYRNPSKRPIVQRIPRDHLEAEVQRHCGPMLERFFPDLRTPEDAGLVCDAGSEAAVNTRLRTELLTAPPAFHFWNDAPQTGGFDGPMLEFLERTLDDADIWKGVAYETGAGLSSVWLLAIGLREVHSFCVDRIVCEKIAEYLRPHPEEHGRWHCHVGPSELMLPPVAIAAATEPADFCLIDGGHGLDTVFNDFLYLNYVLKPGGLLAIDDLQLGSCRLLYELLLQPKLGYALVGRRGKLAILRKNTDRRLLGDFGRYRPLLTQLSGWLGDLPQP